MTEIEIIELTPDDWQAYRALRLEALQTSPQAFGSRYADNLQHPEAWWRGRLEKAENQSWLLFAKKQEQLAGMIGAFEPTDNDVAEIISMFVSPQFRRQGIARALMSAVLERLQSKDRLKIARLEVNNQQLSAVRLYESFGFQIVSTDGGQAGDGKTYDISIMEKRLR